MVSHGSLMMCSFITSLPVVILIIRFGNRSWIPWIVSLVLEAWSFRVASHLSKTNVKPDDSHGHSHGHTSPPTGWKEAWSKAQQMEMTRRSYEIAIFALRSPFLAHVTRPALRLIISPLTRIPLLGDLMVQVVEMLEAYERFHFYPSLS